MDNVPKIIYQFWTGKNPMTQMRRICLDSLKNYVKTDVKLITVDNLKDYILPDHPLHNSFVYLSARDRAHYLQNYFMHFYGGGYADIKFYGPENNFDQAFNILDKNSSACAIGYSDPGGAVPIRSYNNGLTPKYLISSRRVIVKPGSELTGLCFDKMNKYLDVMSKLLESNPSITPDGSPTYPIERNKLRYPFYYACRVVSEAQPSSILHELYPDVKTTIPYK